MEVAWSGSAPSWTSSTKASSVDFQRHLHLHHPVPESCRTMRIVWKGLGSTTSSSVTTWNSVLLKRIPLKTILTPSTSTRYYYYVCCDPTIYRIFLMVENNKSGKERRISAFAYRGLLIGGLSHAPYSAMDVIIHGRTDRDGRRTSSDL